MKKLCAILLITLSISSCKFSQQAQKLYTEKCPNTYAKKNTDGTYTFYLKCTDLYATAKVREYLKEGNITFDVVNGEITGRVTSSDSIPNIYAILKGIGKGIKK